QEVDRPHAAAGVGDHHLDAGALGGQGAGEQAVGGGALAGLLQGGPALGVAFQLRLGVLQLADVAPQPLGALAQIGQDPDELVLPGGGERGVPVERPDLDDDGEAEQEAQQTHGELPAPASRSQQREEPPQARGLLPGPVAVRAGGPVPALVQGPVPVRVLGGAHAPNSFRRMPATLAKIRMPRTTTTPVDSWEPTPSWSPRSTISAAMTVLPTNETTNTFSSKTPSSRARRPPNMASSAATIAIGRYGCSQIGTSGWSKSPSATPISSPIS